MIKTQLPNCPARNAHHGTFPLLTLTVILAVSCQQLQGQTSRWKKHVVYEGLSNQTVVAGDFTKDGLPDVITSAGKATRLFVAPDWNEIVIEQGHDLQFIHSEVWDIDGDGDLDFVGGQFSPGVVVWLEQPNKPTDEPWPFHRISNQVNGVHGLIKGDVDQDGVFDVLSTSSLTESTPFTESMVWFRGPASPRSVDAWQLFAFAHKDAPGLIHYIGFGDVNGDGRPDAATGAKGQPSPRGDYFAWWRADEDPRKPWRKQQLPGRHVGATNIHPVDVNSDGKTDFIASRGHGQGVIWFEGPEWHERPIHPTLDRPHCLLVEDMDEDGDIDAATCAYGAKEAWWFENDGRGNFTNHLVATDQEAYDIRACDMDGDGDFDLVIAGRASNNVVWCENPRK